MTGTGITPEQALDALVAELARNALAGDFMTVTCLAECQLCRNHLLYLLDTVPAAGSTAVITARLRALPEVHRRHRRPGHPDSNPVRLRWAAHDNPADVPNGRKKIPPPDGWLQWCPSCRRMGGQHAGGCDGIAIPRQVASSFDREGCPDGGTCHHGCARGCFRVALSGPLTASGWEDWPPAVREAYGDTDGVL